MDEDVVVSREMLRAIGAETRIAILKALQKRQKTQSELASELGLSAPTVLEHAEQLQKAGLIEPVPEYLDKKWKYLRLTKTARGLVEGRRMSVIMMLASGSALITGGMLFLYVFMPVILGALTGTSTSSGNTNIPVSSCGAGQQCLSNALVSLDATAKSLVGILAMLFLIATIILAALALLERRRMRRI